jgi:hypothetical protein
MVPQPGPSCTAQVTDVSAVPVTVATKLVDPPATTEAAGGSTRTATPWAEGGDAAGVHAARSDAASSDAGNARRVLRTDMECTSFSLRRERADPRLRPHDCGSNGIVDRETGRQTCPAKAERLPTIFGIA